LERIIAMKIKQINKNSLDKGLLIEENRANNVQLMKIENELQEKVEKLNKVLEGNILLNNQLKSNKKIVDEWKLRFEMLEKRGQN
jgi:hypothetical protein